MKIYEFHNADNQAYIHAPDDVCNRCNPDPPRSLAAGWSPPTFEIVDRDEYRSFLPRTDFVTFTLATMVLSSRAVERLHPVLVSCGEILPIQLSNERQNIYLFNVTSIVDAVDMKRSAFLRFPSGRIMKCERMVFDLEQIPDVPLFFKTTQLGPVTDLFATDCAVRAVEEANLTGHDFKLVWSDE